jgi:hypothetical protein
MDRTSSPLNHPIRKIEAQIKRMTMDNCFQKRIVWFVRESAFRRSESFQQCGRVLFSCQLCHIGRSTSVCDKSAFEA